MPRIRLPESPKEGRSTASCIFGGKDDDETKLGPTMAARHRKRGSDEQTTDMHGLRGTSITLRPCNRHPWSLCVFSMLVSHPTSRQAGYGRNVGGVIWGVPCQTTCVCTDI